MASDDLKTVILSDPRTVFSFNDIALLLDSRAADNLKRKINYHVSAGLLQNPRRGIYTKKNFSGEELSLKIYKPSYLSLEYILRREGVNFQYGDAYTVVSYLSREIETASFRIRYQKIRESILLNTKGIDYMENGTNQASPERAFLDLLYLNGDFYPDNPTGLDYAKIKALQGIYESSALEKHVKRIFADA